ncbi:methylmalonyl-CoA mutase, partial [Flavobacteriaceae bacterium]|nr:methylmalonyl-CoA mutase [Flavobacteriaceae bacterium]
MTKSLFDDFNSVSAKAWKQKIQLDLQGEEYQNIIWKSPEGIDVKPFYTLEDLQDFSHDINMPNSWSICETIYTKSGEDANAKALYSLSKGSDSLKFIIPNTAVSVSEMLQGIDTSSTHVYADLSFLDASFIINNWRDHNINFNIDIIGNLTRSGNWYIDLKNDF